MFWRFKDVHFGIRVPRHNFACCLVLGASSAVALAEGPFIGKWKLEPTKSQITGDTIAFAMFSQPFPNRQD